jgi:hypothetical protein
MSVPKVSVHLGKMFKLVKSTIKKYLKKGSKVRFPAHPKKM